MYDLKQLETLLTQGKITRREFIGKVSALGLAAAVSPALSGIIDGDRARAAERWWFES